MTGSGKLTGAIVILFGGAILLAIGILLCFSLIGACIGVPIIFVGLALKVWGIIWLIQWRFQRTQEIITAGIRQGIESARATTPVAVRRPPTPPPPSSAQPAAANKEMPVLINYFYANAELRPTGPITYSDLIQLENTSAITADTPVIIEGAAEWRTWGVIKSEQRS